jgi:hypothetical protein
MKRLLLVIAFVLAMVIPAFAQIWLSPVDPEIQNDSLGVLANYGPIKAKLMMIYTAGEPDVVTPYFAVGQSIATITYWEMKGTGKYRIKVETRNSAGVLIHKAKIGWPTPLEVSSDVFERWTLYAALPPGLPATRGYYTVKVTYIDVARGKTWSQKTKFYASAPE